MFSFNPENNTERENYKLLIGSVVPRPIAFVTTVAEDGTVNGAPFSYFNVVSSNPPLLSISVQRRNGIVKDTARNILKNKEYVIHIVDEYNVNEINATAASLPPNESEIQKTNLTLVESERVNVPGIRESKVRFECILKHSLELDEDNSVGSDLLIGKVVRFHIDKEIYQDGKINPNLLGPISRLAGSDYAKIGELFSIDRPK